MIYNATRQASVILQQDVIDRVRVNLGGRVFDGTVHFGANGSTNKLFVLVNSEIHPIENFPKLQGRIANKNGTASNGRKDRSKFEKSIQGAGEITKDTSHSY